jgi:cobalamin biosynthesis protein CbiG
MSFTNDQVGVERGATQVLFDREPRILDRFQEGGPVRAATESLTGSPIGVEYLQDTDDARLELALENLTEAKAITLRDLANGSGPAVAKIERGVATTIDVLFEKLLLEPLIGHYPESAPVDPPALRGWRAEVRFLRL